MTGSLRRRAAGLACRRCLAIATLPALLAASTAAVLHAVLRPEFGERTPALAAPWLLAPLAVVAACVALTAVVFWPGFAKHRPGADVVDRLQQDRSGGVAAVVAGALAAGFTLVLPLVQALGPLLGAPATTHPHLALHATGDAVIGPAHPRLTFVVPTAAPLQGLWLRPLVGMPAGDWVGTSLVVVLDGERLAPATPPFADARQVAFVPLPQHPARELVLEHAGGTVPLAFPPGAATVVTAATRASAIDLAGLALLTVLATFVALACGALCGLGAGLPTVVAVVATALFLQFAGGVGPLADATLAVLRGQALAAAACFRACAPSLGLGAVAMIVVMLLRPRIRR